MSVKLMFNLVSTLAPSFYFRSSSFLQVRRTSIKYRMSLKFGAIQPRTVVLAERLKNCHRLIKALLISNFSRIPPQTVNLAVVECLKKKSTYNLVSTLVPSCLIGSSSFLQVIRTTIKAQMSSNFYQIGILTAELGALERLEKSI